MASTRNLLGLLVMGIAACSSSDASEGDEQDLTRTKLCDGRFCDHADTLPKSYLARKGAITFKLAQDYPTTLPEIDQPVLDTWSKVSFVSDPDRYLLALRTYFFKGLGIFIPDAKDPKCAPEKKDPACTLVLNPEFVLRPDTDPEQGRHGSLNDVKNFFNVPFMENVDHPREGIHGLTEERHPVTHDLDPTTNGAARTLRSFGIGYYNKRGGFTMGQVFRDAQGKPSTSPTATNAIFPEHTAVIKLLFTTGTPNEVTWLKDSFVWEAHPDRTATDVLKVRLIQIDIAVKDVSRTRDTGAGWVFGTLVFDPNADVKRAHDEFGAPAGDSPWHKMMPVGLMWGNDPGIRPASAEFNAPPERPLAQTVIAKMAPPHALRTRGWGQRMNGPIDNPLSSCMSCHGAASFKSDCRPNADGSAAALSDMIPRSFPDDKTERKQRLRWMRNIQGAVYVPDPANPGLMDKKSSKPGEGFDNDLVTKDGTKYQQLGLDYSAQLRIALEKVGKKCKP